MHSGATVIPLLSCLNCLLPFCSCTQTTWSLADIALLRTKWTIGDVAIRVHLILRVQLARFANSPQCTVL